MRCHCNIIGAMGFELPDAAENSLSIASDQEQRLVSGQSYFESGPCSLDLFSPRTPVAFECTIRGRYFGRKGADRVSADTKSVIERAKRIYAEQLRAALDPCHLNRFVAIEPESGEGISDTHDLARRRHA